jgi:hypothetical protein
MASLKGGGFRDTRIQQNSQTKNNPATSASTIRTNLAKRNKGEEVRRRNQTGTRKRINGKLTERIHGTPG